MTRTITTNAATANAAKLHSFPTFAAASNNSDKNLYMIISRFARGTWLRIPCVTRQTEILQSPSRRYCRTKFSFEVPCFQPHLVGGPGVKPGFAASNATVLFVTLPTPMELAPGIQPGS